MNPPSFLVAEPTELSVEVSHEAAIGGDLSAIGLNLTHAAAKAVAKKPMKSQSRKSSTQKYTEHELLQAI